MFLMIPKSFFKYNFGLLFVYTTVYKIVEADRSMRVSEGVYDRDMTWVSL